MKMVLILAVMSLLFPPTVTLLAQDNNSMQQIVDSIRSVCHAPGEQGKYWDVVATGTGDVNLKLLNRIPGAGIKGEVKFSKGEWEGIQRVLRGQQAGDNADYRQCVRELTPLFLNRISQ